MGSIKWEQFKAGLETSRGWGWRIPQTLGNTAPFFELLMEVAITAAYSGGETTRLFMLHRTVPQAGTPSVYTETLEVVDTSDPIDVPHDPAITQQLRFVVANADIASVAGGQLQTIVQVSALSTGPDFLLREPRGRFRYGPLSDQTFGAGWSFV